MAFKVPKNVPSFNAPQRVLEDRYWGASSTVNNPSNGVGNLGILHGVQGRFEYLLGAHGQLPMYKDKPYVQHASRRFRQLWGRRLSMLVILLLLFIALWLLGFFSTGRESSESASTWAGWLGTSGASSKRIWLERREKVVEAFELSWDAYERYAWGYDVFHPIEKTGEQMSLNGLGWIIIDSLDTMILMNLTSRLRHARQWIANDLTWDQDFPVSMFETTIRMLGGLLSAHYLSTEFPTLAPLTDDLGAASEDLYLEKAKDLADRLISAFDSPSGVPFSFVNLAQYTGQNSTDEDGASSTAEAATLQLEFKYLAKLTGERDFWEKAERVMKVLDENAVQDGLAPIFISSESGKFVGDNIRLGSRGDSYYEYLIKQYLQTNMQETLYQEMWNEALEGVREHLITYSTPSGFTVLGERPNGLQEELSPKMDHLVCFMPGTIALAATNGIPEAKARRLPTWNGKKDADMKLARELMQTCWGMYKCAATGLAAEITYFNIDDPPAPGSAPHHPPESFDPDPKATWREDFVIQEGDVHNLQRPETVESLFYMWRITGEEQYREWGWEMFNSFINYTAVPDAGGFTSLRSVNEIPPVLQDNMESFWLAETLKYFYLLFSPNDLMPLDRIVFNTEAHPLPRFNMGKLFSTGWKRKPRDGNEKIATADL